MSKRFIPLTLALLFTTLLDAKDKPHTPLPEALTSAKTVMLRGDQHAVDNAYNELLKWGRFEVVADKSKADLILDFAFTTEPDAGLTISKESFVVFDAKSGDALYQDKRQIEPSGIWTVLPKKSMARMMIKELRKRLP